jgi:NitT/TauT family transport system substrate-binding protein
LVANEVPLALAAGFKVLRWSTDILPEHPCCRVVVARDTLHAKRPELVRFLRAWILAERVKRDDPTGFINSYAKQANIDFAKAKATLFEPHVSHTADPNTKGIVKFWDYLKKVDYIQSDLDINKFIDVSLYKEALDGLQKENPKDKFFTVLEKRYVAQNTTK